jgi:hypothetical protein
MSHAWIAVDHLTTFLEVREDPLRDPSALKESVNNMVDNILGVGEAEPTSVLLGFAELSLELLEKLAEARGAVGKAETTRMSMEILDELALQRPPG